MSFEEFCAKVASCARVFGVEVDFKHDDLRGKHYANLSNGDTIIGNGKARALDYCRFNNVVFRIEDGDLDRAIKFNFRFRIQFRNKHYLVSDRVYETRHECCVAARTLIQNIKAKHPELSGAIRGFSYHGWIGCEPEPAWR